MAVPTVGVRGSHDLLLRTLPAATGSNELGLTLAVRNKRKLWVKSRQESRAPRQWTGPLGYSDILPEIALVHSQNDWSGGALQDVYDSRFPNRYGRADGVDARPANVLALGMLLDPRRDFLVRNSGAEIGATTHWTAGTGVTVSVQSAAARSGGFGFRAVTDGSRSAGANLIEQSLANPTAHRGRTLVFAAYLRRTSGSDSGVRIIITDTDTSAGVVTRTSSSVTSGSYTYVSVSHAVDSICASLVIAIEADTNETGAHTYEIDDIFVIPAGGIAHAGFAEVASGRYAAFGRMICKWDETNDVWDAVYTNLTKVFTSLQEYNGNIFAAAGNGDNNYVYGSGTSWTISTLSGDAAHAHFFSVSRGTLFRSRYDETDATHYHVATSTNAINGGSWTTEVTVGSSDRHITGLYDINDTVVVGKEDGLHVFNRVVNDWAAAATWQNVTNRFKTLVSTDNFAVGQEFNGWLYLAAAQQTFLRFNRTQGEEMLSSLLFSARQTDFGGRVRAMAFSASQLWLLVDTPTADTTTTKESWLMSLSEEQGEFRLHTIEKVGIGDINGMFVSDSYLWAFGRIYNSDASDYESAIYRWNLPEKSPFPFADDTPAINNAAQDIRMARMDWGLPDQEKAFIILEVYLNDSVLDAEHTVQVLFAMDDGSDVSLGTLNSTTGDNHRTLYFNSISNPESNAVGKSIELVFRLLSDDTVSPQIFAYSLHATYQPTSVEMEKYWVRIGDNLPLKNGGVDANTKATQISRLTTLEDQSWPIYWSEDLDEDNTANTRRGHIVRGSLQREPALETDGPEEGWSFRLVEVTVS